MTDDTAFLEMLIVKLYLIGKLLSSVLYLHSNTNYYKSGQDENKNQLERALGRAHTFAAAFLVPFHDLDL